MSHMFLGDVYVCVTPITKMRSELTDVRIYIIYDTY
jgi:hypothetical protein